MRPWLTAPPLLFWQICLPALLAGGWAIKYPGLGTAGLLLIMAAAWPFLRQEGGFAGLAARLGVLVLVFALGAGLVAHSLSRTAPQTPEYVFARSGQAITATIKEIDALPPRVRFPADQENFAQQPESELPKANPGPETFPGAETLPGPETPLGPEAYRLLLTDITVFPEDAAPSKLPGDLLWTWNVEAQVLPNGRPLRPPLPGQTVRAHLRIREMRGFNNPGVSDSATRHVLEGTLFRAYSTGGKDEAVFGGEGAWGQQTRRALFERFMAALGDAAAPEAPGRAVLPALLFNVRSYITDNQTDLFAKASLSHSLALSGLHLGFMAGLGWLLARFLCRLFPDLMLLMPRGKWAVVCGTPLVASYLWLGGLSPSLLRAALMFACWGVFVLLNRPHPLLDGLCSAVLILFLVNPIVIFDLRLQLSALCLLAIGLVLPGVTELANLTGRLFPSPPTGAAGANTAGAKMLDARWPTMLLGALRTKGRVLLRGATVLLCISAAIQVALAPLQASAFNQAAPWFILNLLWLPLLSVWVFPLAMLGLALCAVPGLSLPASWALSLAALPATWLFKLLEWMESAHILIAPLVVRPHSVAILGYAALLTALFLCLRNLDYARKFPRERLKPLAHIQILFLAGFFCLGFGVWERYVQEHPPGLRVRVIDVGQGLSLLLEGREGQRILIDGGGSALSSFNVGEYVLIPLLTDNRPPRLDAVMNTHPDADHLRGLLPVLRRLDVDAFWLTRPPLEHVEKMLLAGALAETDLIPGRLATGQRLDLDSAHYLRVLYPPADKQGSKNQLSLAAQVVYAPQERGLLLITGDLTKSGARAAIKEAEGAARGHSLRSDVVQVPHHGSKGSLVEDFYKLAAPRVAVVGSGYNNQWGFPSEAVRATLHALGIPLLNTAVDGQIILRWDGDGELLAPERTAPGKADD